VDDRVLELFEDYAAARARGERPDPLPFLEQAGEGAAALGALIERLATSAPPVPAAPATVAMMESLVAGEPPLLAARLHRRLPVDGVVAALVERLGLDPARRAKVKRLYQRLEGGLLDARRIEPRLAAVLAQVLGIREGELTLRPPPPFTADPGVRFARTVDPAVSLRAAAAPPAEDDAPDEIDRLFGLA
jgi:hypothetical protein